MKKIVIMLLGAILTACPNSPTPVINGYEYCQSAETHLKELGCISRDKPYTKKGNSFTVFCQETMKNGINVAPKCLSEIQNCEQINSCFQND